LVLELSFGMLIQLIEFMFETNLVIEYV